MLIAQDSASFSNGWEKVTGSRDDRDGPYYKYKFTCGSKILFMKGLDYNRASMQGQAWLYDTCRNEINDSVSFTLKTISDGKIYAPSFVSGSRGQYFYRFDVSPSTVDTVVLHFDSDSMHCQILDFRYNPFYNSMQGVGFNADIQPNEIAPNILIRYGIDKHFSYQFNLLSLTVIPKDAYNGNSTSVSLFSVYGLVPFFVGSLFTGYRGDDFGTLLPDSGFIRPVLQTIGNVLVYAYILPNTQLHYTIFQSSNPGTGSLASSIFVDSRFDYFHGSNEDWFRFTPSGGVELFFQLSDGRHGRLLPPAAISFQAGESKHIDFSHDFHVDNPFRFFWGTKIFFEI